MTENQLNKLKARLMNIQTQLVGAGGVLKDEPHINSKLQEANNQITKAMRMCDSIKTKDPTKAEQKKARKKRLEGYSYLVPHEVIIQRNEAPTYNRLCRNYSEIRNAKNEVLERTCVVGMDMCYCSKKCAYATNNVCSLRGD